LITATEIAERAITGLKSTMREGEQSLGARLRRAETLTADIDRQIAAGDNLLARLTRIAGVARPAVEQAAVPDAKAVAAAAQAFTDRARARLRGQSGGQSGGLAA
jgi:Domain of unknown function (DUF6468)